MNIQKEIQNKSSSVGKAQQNRIRNQEKRYS